MKFAKAILGKRAERKLSFPVPGADGATTELEAVAVPLTGLEESAVLQFALGYAKGKGVDSPQRGDPLYDLAYMAKAVEFAVRDPDTGTPGDREATFTGGVDEVLAGLTRETIVFLYAIVEDWCDQCSPMQRTLNDGAFLIGVRALAKDGDDGDRFFDRLGPALRRSFSRILAKRLCASLDSSSPGGGPTEPSGTTAPPAPSPPPPSPSPSL